MASGARTSLLDIFLFLFFLLSLHLGCCFSPSRSQDDPDPQHARPKRRKISPLSPSPPASDPDSDSDSDSGDARPDRNGGLGLGLSLTSVRSYLRRFFSVPKRGGREDIRSPPVDLSPCPCPCPRIAADKSPSSGSAGISAADCPCPPGTKHTSFASRADVFACSACGEVLTKPHLLELHQATKHSLSELSDADSGKNIVRIIFLSGWKGRAPPTVRRILKVHNTQRTLARFEEYRDLVRSRAARRGGGAEFERCIADGNERLRFYCSTMLCSLGGGACGSPYCCTCGIVRHGFAGKQADLDGIATHASSWGAHASLPDDLEREFAYLRARRAMLVCRVVAGRVARSASASADEQLEAAEKGAGGAFDSVAAGDEQLLVFNPRAVLPCFVIVYSA